MVSQDHDVRLAYERDDRIGKRLPSGRFIFGDRYIAKKHLDLRQDALRDRFAGDRERGGVWWMTVHDAADVFPLAIDLEMQQRLAGSLLASR